MVPKGYICKSTLNQPARILGFFDTVYRDGVRDSLDQARIAPCDQDSETEKTVSMSMRQRV